MQLKTWHFVTVDQEQKQKTDQRLVRKAAMKDFRRGERLTRIKAHMATQAGKQGVHDDSSERTNFDLQSFLREQGLIARIPGTGIRFVDPFGLTALPDREDAPVLLLHLLRDIGPKLQPTGSDQGYNPLTKLFHYKSIMDEGLVFALLFHAALHLDSIRNRTRSPTTLHYRGEALRSLRLRLRSATDAISDTTILMVGFIAATGIITGDAAAEKTHTYALRTMINLRGGLQNIGGGGSLAMLLTSDHLSAVILDSEPTLEVPDISRNAAAHFVPVHYLQRLVVCDSTLNFVTEIQQAMRTLASLTSLHTQLLRDSILPTPMMSMIQLAYATEHRLLRTRPPSSFDNRMDARLLLYDSCRLTLLICISYIFRNLRASSPTLQVLSSRLIKRVRLLAALDQANLESCHRDMLFWMLIVGGMASTDQTDYVIVLSALLWDKEALTVPLKSFVWSRHMQDEAYRKFLESLGNRLEIRQDCQISLI